MVPELPRMGLSINEGARRPGKRSDFGRCSRPSGIRDRAAIRPWRANT